MNLWKDVMVTVDFMNLKEDGVSAEEAIDVKKGRKKKNTLTTFCSRIWRLRMNSAENGGREWLLESNIIFRK